jgi:hypothetical protein
LICASVCRESSFKQTQKFNDHYLEKHRKPIGEFSFSTMAAEAPADALPCDVRQMRSAANTMGKIAAWRSQGESNPSFGSIYAFYINNLDFDPFVLYDVL